MKKNLLILLLAICLVMCCAITACTADPLPPDNTITITNKAVCTAEDGNVLTITQVTVMDGFTITRKIATLTLSSGVIYTVSGQSINIPTDCVEIE